MNSKLARLKSLADAIEEAFIKNGISNINDVDIQLMIDGDYSWHLTIMREVISPQIIQHSVYYTADSHSKSDEL